MAFRDLSVKNIGRLNGTYLTAFTTRIAFFYIYTACAFIDRDFKVTNETIDFSYSCFSYNIDILLID